MKKIIICFAVCFSVLSTSFAATNPVVTNPVKKNYLITSADLEVTFTSLVAQDFFVSSIYDVSDDALVFRTAQKISFIQIYKDGQLQYQLPVMSDVVKIGKGMFDSGDYKLGFMIQGEPVIQFTEVNIK